MTTGSIFAIAGGFVLVGFAFKTLWLSDTPRPSTKNGWRRQVNTTGSSGITGHERGVVTSDAISDCGSDAGGCE